MHSNETEPTRIMKINLIEAQSLPASEFSTVDHYLSIFNKTGLLSGSDTKRLIRETQNELSSAWKFYMGIGADKQVLVLVAGFTTLPLSLARNCAHVVIYGFNEAEKEIFQNLAHLKKISNYSCVDTLDNLATQFDIIIIGTGEKSHEDRKRLIDEIRKFIHAKTEIWMITTNEISIGQIRVLFSNVIEKLKLKNRDEEHETHIRMPFIERPAVKSRQVKEYLSMIGCQPFAVVGLMPSVLRLRLAKPMKDDRFSHLNGVAVRRLQKITVSEIAIGASPTTSDQSFLERFLLHLPGEHFQHGILKDYRISSSGKVLLFVNFETKNDNSQAVIKLPLNEFAHYRLQLNHQALNHIYQSQEIGDLRFQYFPRPLHTGQFEGQAYFIESILGGKSGDQMRLSKGVKEKLILEIFSFWIGVQKSLAREYFIGENEFHALVEAPLRSVFTFFDPDGKRGRHLEQLIDYLKQQFGEKTLLLSLIHGDFSLKNIILDEQVITLQGIVDWDMSNTLSFPILDLFHFFVRLHRSSYKKPPVVVLSQMLKQKDSHTPFSTLLNMYQETFEINRDQVTALIPLYWIQRIMAHKGTMKLVDRRFMRRNFDAAMDYFAENFST